MATTLWVGHPIQEDLVICVDDDFSFENRWRFTNDLVDYRTVEVWTASSLTKDRSNLKRIKIYGLSCEPMAALLERLSSTSRLEHLEIDTLEIKHATSDVYDFEFLKRLSIDGIRVVDQYGEVPDATDSIKLNIYGNAASLYFGSNSSDHIEGIFDSHTVLQSIGFARPFGGLGGLQFVRISEVLIENFQLVENGRPFHGKLIKKFIAGLVVGLRKIQLNLDRLCSTSYRPDARKLKFLEDFYHYLQTPYHPARKRSVEPELEIFIHGVRLDLKRLKFADYHFGRQLAHVYHHNHQDNQLQLEPCWSVSEVRYLELPDALKLVTVGHEPRQTEHCENRFVELMRNFPNLRVVIVENPNKLQLEPNAFFTFLTLCRALTELRLVTPGFSTTFYERLADVQSLQTLHRFVLIETYGFASVRTNFEFLNYERLRQLRTNLATRAVMLDCVFRKMKPAANFEFQFCSQADPSICYHLGFRKVNCDLWDVLLEKESFRQPNQRQMHRLSGTHTYEQLVWLSHTKNWPLTWHWLDADRLEPAVLEEPDNRSCHLI